MIERPTYEPRPGKQWAIRMYPGGRMEWHQTAPDDVVTGLRAADDLQRGKMVHVEDEHVAAMVWHWIRATRMKIFGDE